MVRPSYVLGGRAMEIVHEKNQLKKFVEEAFKAAEENPILIDKFINQAMEVDINNTIKLKKFIDSDKIIVAESGLKTQTDLKMLKENGVINFLIGESLMKEKNLTLATKTILGI